MCSIVSHLLCMRAVNDNVEKKKKKKKKTHGSESWGQEEAGLHDEPVSYLQVAPL